MKPKGKPQRGVILIAQNDSSLFLRCSAPEYEMELLMFFGLVEIKFAVTYFVELQIQWC